MTEIDVIDVTRLWGEFYTLNTSKKSFNTAFNSVLY
jgi:hypothetical protein